MAFPRERECDARPEGHVEVGRAKTAVGGLQRNFESGGFGSRAGARRSSR